jgi:hydrogenase 3 maturation protease
VKALHQNNFGDNLRRRLDGALRIAIVGIGDELSPVDRLGMLAAHEIEKLHLPGIKVFFAGTMPESMTGPLRIFHPDHVLLLDSADMGARPGTIAIIKPGKIHASLVSSHALPLSVVMKFIAEDSKTRVILLGIQPDTARQNTGLSAPDRDYLDQNLAGLSCILRDIRE